MNSSQKIAAVVTSDAGYLPAACCQLASTARHLPAPDAVELHLVLCDVTPDDIATAQRFFDDRDIPARIHVPEDVAAKINPIANRWPRAAYLRLYFDDLFGPDYARLLYFDADTRVTNSIAPLIDADLKGRAVAAVHDFIYYVTGNIRRRRRDLFLGDDGTYLQSGVMVMDWPLVLDQGVLGRARAFLDKHPDRCIEAPDQDALNAALKNDWAPLDPRWNLHETYLMFGGRHRPFIEHYTSTKPWSERRPWAWAEAAKWYAAELRGTGWDDFVKPQTATDRFKARLAFARFRYAPKIRDTLARVAPFLLKLAGRTTTRTDDQELPWAPRNRTDVETMTEALIEEAAGTRPPIRPPESVLVSPP